MRPCILRRRRLVTRNLGGNRRRVKIERRTMPRNCPVRRVARIYAIFSSKSFEAPYYSTFTTSATL
jgi:hypothetical protein